MDYYYYYYYSCSFSNSQVKILSGISVYLKMPKAPRVENEKEAKC